MEFANGRWARAKAGARNNLAGTVVVTVEALLVAFVLWGLVEYQQANDLRSESRDIVATTDQIAIALLEAETGQRGFLLTLDGAYLEPHNAAIQRLGELQARLGKALGDEGPQRQAFDEVSALLALKLTEISRTIEAARSGDQAAAVDILQTGAGKTLMEEIRGQLAVIRAIEVNQLEDRVDSSERWGTFIAATSIALAFVTLAVATWLFLILRRRQEAGALRATAAAKDEFVGFVSHELRTPIAVIAGNARLLSDGALTQTESNAAAADISAAAERLQDIVDTLLSLSKAESGVALDVEPVLLHRVAHGVSRQHAARFPDRELKIVLQGEAAPAMGDRGAIEQVLFNLLSNAEKYGAPATPITVEVMTLATEGRVNVINRGEHLSAHELDHVFEPFFRRPASTAAAPGIGLGLTVCHRLIAAQGGRMNAEAIPEGGACFSFSLPLAPSDDDAVNAN